MNIKNRTIYCKDNLEILQGINSESVDMIYLDPPFNKKKSFHAPIGSLAEGAEFKDTWYADDVKDGWVLSIAEQYPKLYSYLFNVKGFAKISDYAYLVYMSVRVLECRRILKPSGSLFYHCDYAMSHSIKIMLDIIFNANNFRNEIIWNKGFRGTESERIFQHAFDSIFFYSKSDRYTWNQQYQEYKDKKMTRYNKVDENEKKYALIKRKRIDGSIYYGKTYPKHEGKKINDVINIATMASTSKERVGYPTQKPLELLHRLIKATTNEGNIVLDPFCGCATTCVAAEQLGRQWVGIDVSIKAYSLVIERLKKHIDLFNVKQMDWLVQVEHQQDPPKRTDLDAIQNEFHSAGERRRYSLTKEVREAVWERDGGKCVECLAKENIHYDHIIPFSLGGSNTIDNLQILCASCNLSKGNRSHS